jgi:hypothetical protein
MLGICTMYNLLAEKNGGLTHRVYTEWQLPISGAHSIMMEKSALAGARPPPFTLVTITYKVAVYAPAERADLRGWIGSLR